MGNTNIFMNPYKQPENRLTHNFLCLVEHCEFQRGLCTFLIDGKASLPKNPVLGVKGVFSGGESNPDGAIELITAGGTPLRVYVESKTQNLALTRGQLTRHIHKHCGTDNDLLLVITPRQRDVAVVKSLKTSKVVFHTWQEIAAKVTQLNSRLDRPSFVATQYLDYGSRTGGFEDMNNLSQEDVRHYVATVKSNFDGKVKWVLESVAGGIDFEKYGLKDVESEWTEGWGRVGVHLYFTPKKNYGQWIFFGIYRNPTDHGIPFKHSGVPELAFFFDIDRVKRRRLLARRALIRSLTSLSKYGFEENLTRQITGNQYRFLWKRVPLTEAPDFSEATLKRWVETILKRLSLSAGFKKEML